MENKINELAGSVDLDMFIQGLLLTSKDNSLGTAWEKVATCPHCLFAKQCASLSEQMEDRGQNPRCGQVVDILLGDLSPEDKSIPELPHYPDMGKSIL